MRKINILLNLNHTAMKMKIITLLTVAATLLIVFSTIQNALTRSRTAVPTAVSGGPGDGSGGGATCAASCHNSFGTSAFLRTGWITSNIPAGGYVPGATYQITVSINSPGVHHGFEASCQDATGGFKGTLIKNDSTWVISLAGKSWISHRDSTNALQNDPQLVCTSGYAGTVHNDNFKAWTFDWIAPAAGTGDIAFYAAMVGGDGNGSDTQDSTFRSTLPLSEDISTYFSSITFPSCSGTGSGSATINSTFGTGPY
jgi:hypothetical protein